MRGLVAMRHILKWCASKKKQHKINKTCRIQCSACIYNIDKNAKYFLKKDE